MGGVPYMFTKEGVGAPLNVYKFIYERVPIIVSNNHLPQDS